MTENKAKDVLKEAGYLVDVLWSKDDIRHQANDDAIILTDEEVDEVAEELQSNFDANLGICWDTISIYIDNLKRRNE